jgi:hypothetical protein
MSDAKKNTCAHELCRCPASEGRYCSTYCATAKGTAEIACGCGHPGCATKTAVGAGQAR